MSNNTDQQRSIPAEELKRMESEVVSLYEAADTSYIKMRITSAYMAGAKSEYLRKLTQTKAPVLRWVDASERLPDHAIDVHIKHADCGFESGSYADRDTIEGLLEDDKDHPVFWLEEIITPEADPADRIRVTLPSGATATVSPDASPELLNDLDKMVELAKANVSHTNEGKILEAHPFPLVNKIIRILNEKLEAFGDKDSGIRIFGRIEAAHNIDLLVTQRMEELQAQLAATQKELSALKTHFETEPVHTLLANALRYLTLDQMVSLADALYERMPGESGIRKQLAAKDQQIEDYRKALEVVQAGAYGPRYGGVIPEVVEVLKKYSSK